MIHGKEYRHILLAVYAPASKTWGCLGISRRISLMYRDFQYSSLSDMILSLQAAYRECQHHLLTVYVGMPIPHANIDICENITCSIADSDDNLSTQAAAEDTTSSILGLGLGLGPIKWRALKVRVYKRDLATVTQTVDKFTQFYTTRSIS